MKIPKIANAMNHIEDALVTEAAESRQESQSPLRVKRGVKWGVKWGAAAACFAALAAVCAVALAYRFGGARTPGAGSRPPIAGDRSPDPSATHAGTADSEKVDELATVWPWEYRTAAEKYTGVEADGIPYSGTGRSVSEDWISEYIGNYTFVGYDHADGDKEYTETFALYALRDIAPGRFVAAKMGDQYYVFRRDADIPPATLGELMREIALPDAIELSRFTRHSGKNANGRHFILTHSDDPIWEILAECGDAPFVQDESWTPDGTYLSFTVTSEPLGVYKVALYVTADGDLWTNAFAVPYRFRIGADAAGRILQYATEHSGPTEAEPYQHTVTGTVAKITESDIVMDVEGISMTNDW